MFSTRKPHEIEKTPDEKLKQLQESVKAAGVPDEQIPTIVNDYIPNDKLQMKACEFHGKEKIVVADRAAPSITQPGDAIVRTTSVTICGSDLHFYWDAVPGPKLEAGYILGHEGVGYVEEVGSNVTNVKKGDRVVIPFPISCGECKFCKLKQTTLCDKSNGLPDSTPLYGNKTSALFGYGYMTGGFPGTHAEYVRVPVANTNLLKVPESLKDSQILGLSDILCTAWHGLEIGGVKETDSLVVWGVGPVGLAAVYLAKKLKNVSKIVAIDYNEFRLKQAAQYGATNTINRKDLDPKKEVLKICPGGADVCLDTSGEWPKVGLIHKIIGAVVPKDVSEVADEMVYCARKGGNISLIRAYFAYNTFPIGALMEKSITVRGGQAYVHMYWNYLLERIVAGDIEPSWIFSHIMPFEEATEAYKKFANHEDNCTKIILQTAYGREKQKDSHTVLANPKPFTK